MSMTSLLADRNKQIKPSAIRELFALLRDPEIISFGGGWPDPDLFPVAEMDDIMQHIFATESASALQYGASAGDERLIEWLCQRLNSRYAMSIAPQNVMITTGSIQAVFLTNALLINPGDVIVTEAPTFVGAFSSMQTFQGKIVGIRMDEEGLDTDALATLLQTQSIKYVYVIPEFQNPSGLTMSLARRQHLIALAEQHNFIILEDAPYSDLRFEGEPVPTIYSLDPHGRTIYLGSFSKTFSPMRVGFLVAPAQLIKAILPIKQGIDANTPALTQALIYHFCARGLMDAQIERLCAAYKAKRDAMFAGLDRFMPAGMTWTEPAGGMFIWATLPEGIDATDVFHKAVDNQVAFVPGFAFYPASDDVPRNVMRLSYATPTVAQIECGIERLGQAVNAVIEAQHKQERSK